MLIYTVQSGDTLGSIARRFGLAPFRIAADNRLQNPASLVVGQNLLIQADSVRYTVQEGQTLYSISQEFGVPLERLIEANPDLNPINLQAGQTVIIPLTEERPRRPIIVNGYAYPTIDVNALNCVLPFLTFLSPFSYSITAEGELIAADDNDLVYRALQSGVMPLMTVTNIFDGTFNTEVLSAVINTPEVQQQFIDNIMAELQNKNYYGVNIDMEYISPDDREAYNEFLQRLADALHAESYLLVSAVAPKISADQQGILYESHDYAAQGKAADYVIIMTYEWGYTYSAARAVSPIDEMRRVLDYAVTEIPPEKILMSLPNYGYDWTLPYMRGTAAQSIGFITANDLARQYGAEIKFDEQSQTPYFDYYKNGEQHEVWFDDPRSISEKLGLIDEYGLAGVSWWTINRCYVPHWLLMQDIGEIVKL